MINNNNNNQIQSMCKDYCLEIIRDYLIFPPKKKKVKKETKN